MWEGSGSNRCPCSFGAIGQSSSVDRLKIEEPVLSSPLPLYYVRCWWLQLDHYGFRQHIPGLCGGHLASDRLSKTMLHTYHCKQTTSWTMSRKGLTRCCAFESDCVSCNSMLPLLAMRSITIVRAGYSLSNMSNSAQIFATSSSAFYILLPIVSCNLSVHCATIVAYSCVKSCNPAHHGYAITLKA